MNLMFSKGIPFGNNLLHWDSLFAMRQETAPHFPAETFGFGIHNWL